MEGDGRFVMRCGGGGAVFMGLHFLLFGGATVMFFKQGPGHDPVFWDYATVAILGGLSAYLLYFLLVQKVQIEDGRLKACYVFGGLAPVVWTVELLDIREVVLGSIGKLKKDHPDLVKAPRVQEMINRYETMRTRGAMQLKAAVQFTPIIVVRMKNFEDTQVIVTKPFSRSACRGLMAAFRFHGIAVSGDEKL